MIQAICFTERESPAVEIAVGGSSVDSGVSLLVGDVLTCSAEDAVSYHWRNVYNSGDAAIYGKSLTISQPGSFSYECKVFVKCGAGEICAFTRNISGFARGIALKWDVNYFDNSTLSIVPRTRIIKLSPVSSTRVHSPSSRAELTGRQLGCIFDTRQLGPSTRVSKNAPEFTGRKLGP